jgi:hypothetical protein
MSTSRWTKNGKTYRLPQLNSHLRIEHETNLGEVRTLILAEQAGPRISQTFDLSDIQERGEFSQYLVLTMSATGSFATEFGVSSDVRCTPGNDRTADIAAGPFRLSLPQRRVPIPLIFNSSWFVGSKPSGGFARYPIVRCLRQGKQLEHTKHCAPLCTPAS